MRHRRFLVQLEKEGLDGFLVSRPVDLHYLFGFRGSAGLGLCLEGESVLIVDSRYYESASAAARHVDVRLAPEKLEDTLRELVERPLPGLVVGFDSQHLSHSLFALLESWKTTISWKPASSPAGRLRTVKSADEVRAIKRAFRQAQHAYSLAAPGFAAGRTEAELAGLLELELRRRGAEGFAFETIVAAGARSSLPHSMPGRSKWDGRAPLLVDFGLRLDGYCSDLTRMMFMSGASEEVEKVAAVVRDARSKALEVIRPGVQACEVDKAARQWIADKGYGEWFGHALGHGLGLEVHELPRISRDSRQPLESGMCFTVEPGIYLPGRFGIRLEDAVVVVDDGFEFLSNPHA